ncbi:MAG: RCC1 domain-containing protein, partial [Coriobacteriia bacterium]|nr:RCC1 domain-containing protein [Coriobacteriia bacterium]
MDQVPMKAARTGWQVVSAGTYYSLGIKADGTLWAWGYNGSGQLGNGSTVDAETPVRAGDAADK